MKGKLFESELSVGVCSREGYGSPRNCLFTP